MWVVSVVVVSLVWLGVLGCWDVVLVCLVGWYRFVVVWFVC